jgi:hypothetical protein
VSGPRPRPARAPGYDNLETSCVYLSAPGDLSSGRAGCRGRIYLRRVLPFPCSS